MQILIVVAIIAALFAAYHFHLLATIKAALSKPKDASTGAVNAPGSVIAPPAPVVPPADHGATPPATAGATGSLVGQAVPGGDTPDTNGAIAIPGIAAKFAPGSRFLTVAALPYVSAGSAQAFCIAANCGNTQFSEQITGLASVAALAVVPNPAATVAVGGAAFHLAGQAPGEKRVVLSNVISLSAKLTSITDIVAKYQTVPDYGTNTGSGAGFGPKH